jgi:hypothetical protein
MALYPDWKGGTGMKEPIGTANPEATILIKYEGGLADRHELSLDRYLESVTGWRDFLTLATEIVLRSYPELRHLKRPELFEFRIEAERPGSYEVVLWFTLGAAAGGIIGNRADAAFIALMRRLPKWYERLVTTHVRTKQSTANVDDIVSALNEMTRSENIELAEFTDSPPEVSEDSEDDIPVDAGETDPQSRARKLVEKLDSSLKHAAAPIGPDCNSVTVVNVTLDLEIATFGAYEKMALDRPLTLPPPSGVWTKTSVKFERINNKTGRALIYLLKGEAHSETASYARIVDRAYSAPGNVYARAFAESLPLEVWARQVKAERGKLNHMWQISHVAPEQFSLYGPPDSRA